MNVNYTGTQSYITTFSYLLDEKCWVLLLNLIVWLQTFQPIILMYRMVNFVYHHCKRIFIVLSLKIPEMATADYMGAGDGTELLPFSNTNTESDSFPIIIYYIIYF